jgi:GT2 family glycosyltransferase
VFVGTKKFYVRGVTYGAFRPDAQKHEYHDLKRIDRDFAHMAASGFNTVRIPHTMPPRALLDVAATHGLRVMAGLSAEHYVGYLIDHKGAPDIEEIVRAKVRTCAGHPALLAYALGNEIPGQLVRWLGAGRVQRYLRRLCRAVKSEDPAALVTYVNYPTTEYLQLPFLDLVCFNVYLESTDRLEAYLARLHCLAGDRPLMLSELGLDSLRNGEEAQARSLDWQVRMAYRSGCAGVVVFAWTDEWYRAGEDVDDWKFGLTDEHRHPKPALGAVATAYREVPFPPHRRWPRISVVVCTFNGSRTIRSCLAALAKLDYPDFEVIVVDDGSTDDTAGIVQGYPVRLIRTENRGLGAARNLGLESANGEIVAYLDDDAYPDPHWLQYLADTFVTTSYAAVGGPNLAPAGDGFVADCVANAPGGPTHVLLSDRDAEHIPGCNMAFRTEVLRAIGGFDPQFRVAGDDVDVCWELERRGWKLAFNPAALVWHHRRNSVRAYWKQQRGYGRAEALLERKWPEKYNGAGHPVWAGRVYGGVLGRLLGRSGRIYHGPWGIAPFQSLYEPAPGFFRSLLLMPEWYLVIAVLAGVAALGMVWKPLLLALPLLGGAMTAPVLQAASAAAAARFPTTSRRRGARAARRLVTAGLHLLQPLARLVGRVQHGLTPWRHRGRFPLRLPVPRTLAAVRKGRWEGPAEKLYSIETYLRASGALVRRGGDYDRWDLEVRGGLLAGARMLLAIEDHGPNTQLVRVRSWPVFSRSGLLLLLSLCVLRSAAVADHASAAASILAFITLFLALRKLHEAARSTAAVLAIVTREGVQPR